ncbi:hypothetical protein [Pseudomonas brassicacearum]|uniref:Uncharacterized protein n=1 Tax=Pseudomonas brassicacearum TaxID=930166 RepID=A0AAJ3G0K0_9PSED|nr:hypothetical protein [Pseudomonas brassicacearum]NUT83197.1 hypothetical protein [Pseudomonas brassicacearum]
MDTELKEKINNTQFGTEITIRGYFLDNHNISRKTGLLSGFSFASDTLEIYNTTYDKPETILLSKLADSPTGPMIEGHGPISTYGPDARNPSMREGLEAKLRSASVGQDLSLKGHFSDDSAHSMTYKKGKLKNVDWSANRLYVQDSYDKEVVVVLSEIYEVDPREVFGGRQLFNKWVLRADLDGWRLAKSV